MFRFVWLFSRRPFDRNHNWTRSSKHIDMLYSQSSVESDDPPDRFAWVLGWLGICYCQVLQNEAKTGQINLMRTSLVMLLVCWISSDNHCTRKLTKDHCNSYVSLGPERMQGLQCRRSHKKLGEVQRRTKRQRRTLHILLQWPNGGGGNVWWTQKVQVFIKTCLCWFFFMVLGCFVNGTSLQSNRHGVKFVKPNIGNSTVEHYRKFSSSCHFFNTCKINRISCKILSNMYYIQNSLDSQCRIWHPTAIIQLQVHATGSQGTENTLWKYIRIDFGSRFFRIDTVSHELGR